MKERSPKEEMITVKNIDYYDKPEFWPFMPKEMFDILELAELKGLFRGELIVAEVPKRLFDKMMSDYNAAKR